MNNTELTSLFIQESLRDSEKDFMHSLCSESFPHFTVVAITASNEHQAEVFRQQLKIRELPPYTEFVVIPDKNGERIGSGGATLSVIKYVKEKYGQFKGISVVCIHSGGDSKRMPNYSALGKLFSPVPRILPNGKPSTLFDELMISMASVPARMPEGMLLLSGDALLLFNPLQIDYSGKNAAAISFKEDVNVGIEHGVFLGGKNGYVNKFLHKQSEDTLRKLGAVNKNGKVAIDTGAVIFSTDILESLYCLVETEQGEKKYINSKTRLSLYGDFLYPMAEDSTLEQFYQEKPEGELNDELHEARTVIWESLRKYKIKLMNLAPAKFIHFGTTMEVLSLMNNGYRDYESIGWKNKIYSSINNNIAGYNSVLSPNASVGEGSYLETSYIHGNVSVGKNCFISFAELENVNIPDNSVVHVLKQIDGRFVCRIYGISDNPKENRFFGKELEDSLWKAKIYPVCESVSEAVSASLNMYHVLIDNTGDKVSWEKSEKKSLESGFNEADSKAIILWSRRMEDYVRMDELASYIIDGRPAKFGENILKNKGLAVIQKQWLDKHIANLNINKLNDFSYLIRLYYYLGVETTENEYFEKCFDTIALTVLSKNLETVNYNRQLKIAKDFAKVELPLRVNWGGGWSDTCPHCLENGGTVINAAISLNGKFPVLATIKKIKEKKIIFESSDMQVYGEFTELKELQKTGDPFDPYALQKSCLISCGLIPVNNNDENLEEILDRLGAGFILHTEVTNVPKGSGLGTSSILAAACCKVLFDFVGKKYSDNELYSTVLTMEQIMSTGGGWQDQVGGATNGIKFVTSEPGLMQSIKVEHIQLGDETKAELNERFCLIYSGQRRLAKNILRNVVGRYIGNDKDSLYAHKEIQKVAVLMKFALEKGRFDEFAELLDYHWQLSKKIDEGSTNTLIEQIFNSIDDLIDARMVCGAGGGGFLQVILKKGISKQQVHNRLKEVFQDFDVDVWESKIIF